MKRLAFITMMASLLILAWVVGYCTPTQAWMPPGVRNMIEVTEIRPVVIPVEPGHVFYDYAPENGYHVKIIGTDTLSLIMYTGQPDPLHHMSVNHEDETVIILVNAERLGLALEDLFRNNYALERDLVDLMRAYEDLKSQLQSI